MTAAASRARQGLPPTVEDQSVLALVAQIVSRPNGKGPAEAGPSQTTLTCPRQKESHDESTQAL